MNATEFYSFMLAESQEHPGFKGTMAYSCIKDEERTLALLDIISKTMTPGTTGIDLGAGTGVLGLWFLLGGGGFLYSVEMDVKYCDFIAAAGKKLEVSNRLEVACDDATKFKPTKSLDYVMAELIGNGLANEPIVQAVMHIRQFAGQQCLYIPQGATLSVSIYDWIKRKQISDEVVVDRVHFPQNTRIGIDSTADIPPNEPGIFDYVDVHTYLDYPGGYSTGAFDYLCQTKQITATKHVHIPRAQIYLGEKLRVHVKYEYGAEVNIECLGIVDSAGDYLVQAKSMA